MAVSWIKKTKTQTLETEEVETGYFTAKNYTDILNCELYNSKTPVVSSQDNVH